MAATRITESTGRTGQSAFSPLVITSDTHTHMRTRPTEPSRERLERNPFYGNRANRPTRPCMTRELFEIGQENRK